MIAILKGPEGLEARLDQEGQYRIGRSDSSTIFISGPTFDRPKTIAERHTSINQDHLHLLVETGFLRLTDNKSTFGSYLNDKKFSMIDITESKTYKLKLGNVEFELRYEGHTPQD